MPAVTFALPILPGKTEATKNFFKEVAGPRKKGHDDSRRRVGLTREQVWLQHTPQGDMIIVMLDGSDSAKSNQQFAALKDPYDVWFKQQVQVIAGIDLNEPMPPFPKTVHDWHSR
ncbi:MAG: hypothetical protein EXR47_04350 [Dehalococcoidia bacterium]|nr:hypothetical protein [Dehalococcoidia bacterium]